MNQRDSGLWLIPILAAVALYLPFLTGTQSPSMLSGQTIVDGQSRFALGTLVTGETPGELLLRRFLEAKDPSSTSALSTPYDLNFLIATVPDPIDSGLRHMFDRHVAAIQRAAETAGYILEGFDQPWSRRDGEGRAEKEEPKDKKLQRRHEREPGVILFRGQESRKELLLVFLIGETPTAGIHKAALRKSMEAIQGLCSWGKTSRCKEKYKVLAPTFSGSVDSLRIVIESWRATEGESGREFNIISGSATAIDKNSQLNLKGVNFSATVAHDDDAIESFLSYLKEKRIRPDLRKIAILREGSTAYGAQVERVPEEAQADKVPILKLTFPLHISQLRKAAEKARGPGKEAASELPRVRPRNLRLSLEEEDEPKDLIPPFSSFDTFSVELILSNLLATISKEDIRYLGLFSTDIRDQIFLAREIRKHAPNVTLFTLGADLVYLHSDINLDFQGMLVIAAYPLFSVNQVWTYPFEGNRYRLQFPTDTAQGVYNATLALLEQPQKMLEYGAAFADYEESSAMRKPQIWLGVVGRNNLWPVEILGKDKKDYLYLAKMTGGGNTKQDFGWTGLYSTALLYILSFAGLLAVAISLVLVVEFFPSHTPRKSRTAKWLRANMAWLLKLFGDSVFLTFRFERRVYLFSFSIGLLTFSLIVLRLLMRLSVPPPESHCSPLLLFLTLGMLTPLLLSTVLVGTRIWSSAKRSLMGYRWPLWASLISMVLAPLLILFLAGIFAYDICRSGPKTQFFLYLRMLNPASGLSPLMPLFFVAAAGLLWILSSLGCLRSIEEVEGPRSQRSALPFLNFTSPSFAGLAQSESRVRHFVTCSFSELPMWWGVTLLVAVPSVYLFGVRLVPSFESKYFYWFFGVAFILVYLTLAMIFLRLLCVWWFSRCLLQRLSWHPLLRAFQSLPDVWPGMPRIELISSFMPYTGLEYCIDQAGRLARLAKEIGGQLWQQAASLEALARDAGGFLNRALQAEAEGRWRQALRLRYAATVALSRASSVVAGALESHWRLTPGISWNLADEKESEWIKQGEHFLAARTVAFLTHIFSQMQNLICFVIVSLLLMLLAVTSYPFQPKDWLLWFNWSIILSTVLFSMVVFVQIGRDRILSLLSKTTPGQVSWNREFILRVLIYGILPILALLGAQFPETLRRALSWLTTLQGSP
ncbi:MAG: hypothetical protein HY694_15990 [Deltaproteobacteria bacterium]|nr:hypothetical protein [Deltaproteobacteria bacterium]